MRTRTSTIAMTELALLISNSNPEHLTDILFLDVAIVSNAINVGLWW
jgi:hypothetical protein